MKKEKKTTETLGSQGNQKINQKEKDTNNYWKRKTEIFKLKNKLLQPTTSQKKKKKKKKKQQYYKNLFENDKENCRAIRRAVKKSTTQSVKLIIIHHSPYCWW